MKVDNPMPIALIAALTALLLTSVFLPTVIRFALTKRLFARPSERSSHTQPTPSLGGVGIFVGLFMATFFWAPSVSFEELRYPLLAVLVVFLTGLKDDLVPLSALKKFIAQVIVALLIVYFADIRLTSLHGMFSWEAAMSYELSMVLSVFTVLVVINAFNLIDGINGLAASLGCIVFGIVGTWFALVGETSFAVLALSSCGALLGFLRYNLLPPVKIFMGDTGSLVIGTIAAALILQFIELNDALPLGHAFYVESVPVVAMTIIAIPLFDTLRVFTTRIIRGTSPFQPDRRHIHHLLIDYGFSHAAATGILVACQVTLIALVYLLQGQMEQHLLLLFLLSITMLATYVLHKATMEKKAALQQLLKTEHAATTETPVLEEEQHVS